MGDKILEKFTRDLEKLLPPNLHHLLGLDYIPWDKVAARHADVSEPDLTAQFEAYGLVKARFDLEALASLKIPEGSWGCMRCGFCCSSMRPGPVPAETFRQWEEADAPVAWFYQPRRRSGPKILYRCWYHNGVRLRICPFMFINLRDSRPFCSIYSMGDDHRPPVCSKYVPRHETCTAEKLKIDPWESN